ncbi:Receptor-type tyrosine-protein phosphatase T [Aphelenchoides bicaudatus]|nr:Receptor-type tyrosine-protein phosphatase T [Aphelenchoides bicaudatus]
MRPKSFGNTSKNNSPPRQLPPRTRRKKGPTRRAAATVIDEEDGATRVTVENDALVPVPAKHLKKPHELSMENFAASLARKEIEGLKAEFKELQALQPPDAPYTEFTAGKGKNRYDNIVCFDRTRVVLTYQVPPESSYIHANWVGSSIVKLTNKYICTQGPMDNTINDFWRMIWQIYSFVKHGWLGNAQKCMFEIGQGSLNLINYVPSKVWILLMLLMIVQCAQAQTDVGVPLNGTRGSITRDEPSLFDKIELYVELVYIWVKWVLGWIYSLITTATTMKYIYDRILTRVYIV